MPRLVVIAGDSLQAEEAALAWLPSDTPHTRRSGDELTPEVLFTDLGQPGMFAETRCLLYTDIITAKLGKKDQERIDGMLMRLPDDTHLACVQVVQEETKAKTESKLKHANLKLFSTGVKPLDMRGRASGTGAARWLADRARERHGVTITPQQAGRILEASGSPALAAAELAKLELLREGEGVWAVPDSALTQLLQSSPAARLYELADQLLAQPQAAHRMLADWFNAEPETFRLIVELKRKLQQLRSVRRGEQVYPPFAARAAQALSRQLSGERYAQAWAALASLEHGLKTGAYPAESSRQSELTALQVFISDLTRAMRA